ncbi:MAG TPA: DUF2800 domain-containing protein [Aquabacterium sp.]|nr:DUF2800 domain-containing protein [Aquabacterium sp.]
MTEHTLTPIAQAVDHKARAHARLSASGSYRWMICTMSPQAEEGFPDTTNPSSEDGTYVHEQNDIQILYWLGQITQEQYIAKLKQCDEAYLALLSERGLSHDQAALHVKDQKALSQFCVNWAIEFIKGLWASEGRENVTVWVEQRFDLTAWVPESFGTSDLTIATPSKIYVIDWKAGRNMVYAADNPQLRLYGLGVYGLVGALYDFSEIEMMIVMPKHEFIDSETMSVEALLHWGDTVVKPAAHAAHTGDGAQFVPSLEEDGQCRWCKARKVCKARAQLAQGVVATSTAPGLMTVEELANVYPHLSAVISWAKDVKDHVDAQVLAGAKGYGLKVVEGRSNRVITDVSQAKLRLCEAGYNIEIITEAPPTERTLLGLSALEKVVGKSRLPEILGDVLKKPPGAKTVVPESDPRDAVDVQRESAEDAFGALD